MLACNAAVPKVVSSAFAAAAEGLSFIVSATNTVSEFQPQIAKFGAPQPQVAQVLRQP